MQKFRLLQQAADRGAPPTRLSLQQSSTRLDILVHAKEVSGIVLLLDGGKSRIGFSAEGIAHRKVPGEIDQRTRNQRRAEKQTVAAERRAIKKAARRLLKKQMVDELLDES